MSNVYVLAVVGFYYRKSIGVGPFRVNLSKSGIGYSVGAPGVRTGVSAHGKRYTTFSVPGTGVGYKTSGTGQGCLAVIIGAIVLAGILVKTIQHLL